MVIFRIARERNTRMFAAAAIVAALATTSPARASIDDRDVKPFAVIDHALERWRGRPRPLSLSYVVTFTGHNKDRVFYRRFRVDDSVAAHATHVTMLESQGMAPPFLAPEKQRLLPTETFGFVAAEALEPGPAATPAPAMTNVPVIAAVRANIRYPYDVSLIGLERVDDRPAYHLRMDPRHTPDAYPLREIWIDASTYDVLQVTAQQFERLGPIAIPYRVNARYGEQGPYWLISHAEAGATVRAGLFTYGSRADADFDDFQYSP